MNSPKPTKNILAVSTKQVTAQKLNGLKRQILGLAAQYESIQIQLERLGYPRDQMCRNYDSERAHYLKKDLLDRLQHCARLADVKGDYTKPVPYEQTRAGKKWMAGEPQRRAERIATAHRQMEQALAEQARRATLSTEERDVEDRRIIELSLSERKGLDSGSLS